MSLVTAKQKLQYRRQHSGQGPRVCACDHL